MPRLIVLCAAFTCWAAAMAIAGALPWWVPFVAWLAPSGALGACLLLEIVICKTKNRRRR
jgi:hypothetical protein